jgi:hypothetical protein
MAALAASDASVWVIHVLSRRKVEGGVAAFRTGRNGRELNDLSPNHDAL